MRCESCSMVFMSSEFRQNYANEGGLFYMTLDSILTGSSLFVLEAMAYGDGGMVYAKDTVGTNLIMITIQAASKLRNIKSMTGNGGSFYLEGEKIKLKITASSTVTDSEATAGKGGLVYVNKADQVDFDSPLTSFFGMKSKLEGSILYSAYN